LPKQKLKTHKGAAKRFKLTASGKAMRRHSFARHILTSKAAGRKRRLAQAEQVSAPDAAHVRRMLPYGL
jgi:large subunit ribosomal protein L35